jgi:1-acyl-sn-glycerol-3-phosphate acyltransferase
VIALLILGIVIFITYPFDRRGKVIHHYGRLWGKIALLVNRVKVRVEGIEHLKGEGPYIFMSNHQGTYDIFALLGHLPFQFRWLAKKELFSIPFFGWVMAAAGYISIDREGTRKTVEAMNEAARKIREGMSLLIFPEGSRSPDGSIQPFKKGGFTLAIKSKVPIIPISISGSREVMPKEKFTSASGEIRIRIDHPIEIQNYSLKDRKSLMEKVSKTISKNFKLISSPSSHPSPVKGEGDIGERNR